MKIEIVGSAKFPVGRWALLAQDAMMVSAFGIWFAVLGVSPVLLFRALMAG